MIANLIRTALAPTIENRLNGESIRLHAIINEMENALNDVKYIADHISTYDIAADISIDSYEIGRSIDVSAIKLDYSALGRHIVGNLEIDASDFFIDYSDLAERIAREIVGELEIDNSELARIVNARFNTVNTNLQTVERKMDLILKHLGITPENA